jgi:hypothetical protein
MKSSENFGRVNLDKENTPHRPSSGGIFAFAAMVSFSLFATAASAVLTLVTSKVSTPLPPSILSKKVFPPDFIFGTSTSAYQVEGGWLDGGKGLSNWDAFSHTPGQISNGDTGDIANDMYHLYPEDIELMKSYGLRHYRFSISWNRILPTGVGTVSQEALDYYNDLINQLLSHGIEPHVTIFHNDIPLALMMYPHNPQPFLDSENFPTWYTDYAQVLFENFGDRVTHWFTFNEPFCTAVFGPLGDSVSPSLCLYLSTSLDLCLSPLSHSFSGSLSDRSQRHHRSCHHGPIVSLQIPSNSKRNNWHRPQHCSLLSQGP